MPLLGALPPEVELYGKGPGLDTCDRTPRRVFDLPPRFAINEAFCVVPGSVGIMQDEGVGVRMRQALLNGWAWPRAEDSWKRRGGVVCPETWAHNDELAYLTGYARPFCVSDYPNPGTLPITIAMLADAGVRRVSMFGFDYLFDPPVRDFPGGQKHPYAQCIAELWVAAVGHEPYRDANYEGNHIHPVARTVAEERGLELVDAGSPESEG